MHVHLGRHGYYEIAVQASGCMELQHLHVPRVPTGSSGCQSCWCALLDLFNDVSMTQEELSKAVKYQKCGWEIDTWYWALSQAEQQPCLKAVRADTKPEFSLKMTETSNPLAEEDWTLVSAWGRRKKLLPSFS